METKDKTDHLVTLKVMRLTRPNLCSPLVVTSENRDLPGDLFNEALRKDASCVSGLENLALGEFLLLPQSFGNIYLGEMFSSYVCVHNNCTKPVHNVSVKASLQTSSQRIALFPHASQSNEWSAEELLPGQIVNAIVHHEVKEISTHILVCEVMYQSTPTSEQASFRKYFKFQVMKPLDVKTKFYNAESDEVYLEAQVQNVTAGAICLEKVILDPSHLFTVKSLNYFDVTSETKSSESKENSDTTETTNSVFGPINSLGPGDSRQYLYCLSPKEEVRHNLLLQKEGANIGKLDIVWRSALGEQGRLQTSQLQRVVQGQNDIRLTIEKIPNVVQLEKAFDFICKVTNCCERVIELSLGLDPVAAPALVWAGKSNYRLGKLSPGEALTVPLQMVPLTTGLQTISGVRLIDIFLKRIHDYDDLAQVLVL